MTEIIEGKQELWYPGFKGGNSFIHNLSSYRPRTGEKDSIGISFDIERVVSWDSKSYELFPFTYSLMIVATLPRPHSERKRNELIKRFEEQASQLEGFVLDEGSNFNVKYTNPDHYGIFVNLIDETSLFETVAIGVIQKMELPTLDLLIDSIPYAVEVFNKLSPYKLEDAVVEQSIEIARQSDKVIPRCRIKGPEAYREYCDRRAKERRAKEDSGSEKRRLLRFF